MEELHLTVRALAILKALGVTKPEELQNLAIPLPGTVVQKGTFPFFQPLKMTTKPYIELVAAQMHLVEKTMYLPDGWED